MTLVVVWLSKIVSHPLVSGILIPAITNALRDFFEGQAARLERKAAVRQAQGASKIDKALVRAEALREASKKLSDRSAYPR